MHPLPLKRRGLRGVTGDEDRRRSIPREVYRQGGAPRGRTNDGGASECVGRDGKVEGHGVVIARAAVERARRRQARGASRSAPIWARYPPAAA